MKAQYYIKTKLLGLWFVLFMCCPYAYGWDYLGEDSRRINHMVAHIRPMVSISARDYIPQSPTFFVARGQNYLINNFGGNYTGAQIIELLHREMTIENVPNGFLHTEAPDDPSNPGGIYQQIQFAPGSDPIALSQDIYWNYGAYDNEFTPDVLARAMQWELPGTTEEQLIAAIVANGREQGRRAAEYLANRREQYRIRAEVRRDYMNVILQENEDPSTYQIFEEPPENLQVIHQDPHKKLKQTIAEHNMLNPITSKNSLVAATRVIADRAAANFEANIEENIENFTKEDRLYDNVVISAGSEEYNDSQLPNSQIAIWTKTIYSNLEQERASYSNPYHGTVYGLWFGAEVTPEFGYLGVAIGYTPSRVTSKGAIGEAGKVTTKSNTTNYSLYSHINFAEKLFVNGSASFALGKVESERSISINGVNYKGKQNYKNAGIILDGEFGYKHKMEQNYYIIPSIGLRYIYNVASRRSETGIPFLQSEISSSNSSELVAIGSISFKAPKITYTNLILTPYVTFAYERVVQQSLKLPVTSYGIGRSFTIAPVKAESKHKNHAGQYNMNLGLKSQYKNLDIIANYDLHLYQYYQGHQVSLALKMHL
ncbi:MAG: autotransporter outer membrane beta-barrel domain-containing protein [Alphaproteobacteria bacterium]|nr:autotransporter outer membrane beta-barrel domain-containing protein [Alphaproteobacteria bacterium]